MKHASKASIFKQKQIILRAKQASTPQELSKFGAKRQFFASEFEIWKIFNLKIQYRWDSCKISLAIKIWETLDMSPIEGDILKYAFS